MRGSINESDDETNVLGGGEEGSIGSGTGTLERTHAASPVILGMCMDYSPNSPSKFCGNLPHGFFN